MGKPCPRCTSGPMFLGSCREELPSLATHLPVKCSWLSHFQLHLHRLESWLWDSCLLPAFHTSRVAWWHLASNGPGGLSVMLMLSCNTDLMIDDYSGYQWPELLRWFTEVLDSKRESLGHMYPLERVRTNCLRSNNIEKHPGSLMEAEMNPRQPCG